MTPLMTSEGEVSLVSRLDSIFQKIAEYPHSASFRAMAARVHRDLQNSEGASAPSRHPNEHESRLLPLMVQSKCVLCRTELHEHCIVRPLPALLDASLRRFPLAFGFVLEMHSLLHRMAARWRLRYAAYFLVVSAEEMAERLVPNTRTHSYMRDMRNFSERYPWATILDLEMYRDAWLAGAEWGSHIYTQARGASLNQA